MAAAGSHDESRQGRISRLYRDLMPAGIRLAYLLTGDQAAAEDLMHDAFLKFVGRLQFLRDPNAHEAYLRRTIVNLSKNHFRRRALERKHLAREAAFRQPQHVEPDVPLFQSMRQALRDLPVRQRAAIVLRFYEDRPEGEIADILGCRPATVRSLISRGLQALRAQPEVTS